MSDPVPFETPPPAGTLPATANSGALTGTIAQEPNGDPSNVLPSIPGFDIEKELGRGAMGVVYKARQNGLSRDVAIKMVLHGAYAGRESLRRFRSEAEAIARFQHPNVVQVYAIGDIGTLPYFVLEYVTGGSLDRMLESGPLPVPQAVRFIAEIAEGVAAAHAVGIIHRDIKPANILLQNRNGELHPKVADFGIAKDLSGGGETATGAVVGTPAYMSPEQAAGRVREIGPASDVYAIGAMLFEVLTGEPPFRGESLLSTLDLVRYSAPRPVRSLRRDVPRGVEAICLKCLEKEPKDRYSSAGDLAADLRRVQAGERPLALGASNTASRRRVLQGTGIVVLIALFPWLLSLFHSSSPQELKTLAPRNPVQVLIVAVHQYTSPQLTTSWQYSQRDAAAFRRSLMENWGVPEENIRLMCQSREREDPTVVPTLANIRRELQALRGRTQGDSTVLVFLSGSGVEWRDAQNHEQFYFIPSDGSVDSPQTLLSESEIAEILAETPSRASLVLVDACRTNQKVVSRTTLSPPRLSEKSAIFFATQSGQVSHEDQVLRHGVFARSILNALDEGPGKDPRDLMLGDLVKYVTEDMAVAVDRLRLPRQSPDLQGQLPRDTMLMQRSAEKANMLD